MPGIRTSAITYRRGISNSTPNFFLVAQANYVIPQPTNRFRQNYVPSIAPPPPTTPSAPTITSITPGDQSLSLIFTPPTSNGGSSIINYQYSINGGTYINANTTSSPITITGLTNGTTYSLVLRAVNSIGTGDESNILSGTPVSPTTFTFSLSSGFSPIITTDSTISKSTYLTEGRVESDLISVEIGTSCTTIADNCFNLFNITSNLASVIFLGNSVTSIGNYSFAYNYSPSSFNTIIIPSSVTSLGEFCFFECNLNGTITIPNSVSSIGQYCFAQCQILDRVIFEVGSTITSLSTACFGGCPQLSTINIPASVTKIGNSTFIACSSLSPGGITFDGTLVTEFVGSSFAYCTGLFSLNFIPSSVTKLGPNSFAYCTGLSGTIQILSTIENIDIGCFQGCINITTIVIPSSVTFINENMMQDCTSLSTVIFRNQSTLSTLYSGMLIGLTQNIQISFYLLTPSASYSSLSVVTKSYFIDPPPSNWNYFYSTNPSPI
jgi:hypothetical protein